MATLSSVDDLEEGLISFPPLLFVMDLFSDWPDGVIGSLTVHLQNLHITVADVDFSADIDDASFFEGLSARMFHLLGLCLSR